jgi:hypothetical protein
MNAPPKAFSPMVDTNPSTDPSNTQGKRQGISVMIPANLFDRLEHRARVNGETVVTLASRIVRETLRSMPLD